MIKVTRNPKTGKFGFAPKAANHEQIAASQRYKTRAAAWKGIAANYCLYNGIPSKDLKSNEHWPKFKQWFKSTVIDETRVKKAKK